ncbi:DUF4271 domain-containing protein [Halpernia sp.]|uniref:DUF4271 domain-containing protein n=1 Tax=Halpernia sp. TaxID=2782209 RepID=UPI003A8FFF9E
MLISLQREASLKDFLSQSFENSSNIFLTWGITSIVFVTLLSVLISQYIPFIPNYIQDRSFFGFELNKFGFTFLSVSVFYLLKSVLTYFYFYAVRNQKKWQKFYFIATRFYFLIAILLFVGCIQIYYFPQNRLETFQTYSFLFVLIFIFKNFFYLFHNSKILPKNWYYKFLYICTLQIIPLLVLWKFLFD